MRWLDVASTPELVANTAGEQLRSLLSRAQQQRGRASAALSGGSAAIGPLGSAGFQHGEQPLLAERLDLWWADERHVPLGDDDRNDLPALAALGPLRPPDERLHRVAGPPASLAQAAADYDRRLVAWVARCRADGRPPWDVVLLGMGPDGHVASLFPGRAEGDTPALAVAVPDSPKPPPRRVSLTLGALALADEVWVLATGSAKAEGVAAALAGEQALPAAAVRGRVRTRWFVDAAAVSRVPDRLLDDVLGQGPGRGR